MTRIALAAAALALAACSHGGKQEPTSKASTAPAPSRAEAAAAPGGHMAMCPMAVEGTKVAAADMPDGEALTFTTSPERADELRSRVRAMADMHNRHHAGGEAGEMHPHHEGMAMPPPSQAKVEDVDGGARLVVTPRDPADLAKLQGTVRAHAEQMQQGGCGMMGGPPATR